MYIYRTNIKLSLPVLVLVLLTLSTITLIYLYAFDKLPDKWASIVGGMAISSLVSLIQFSINYKTYKSSEKLEDSGVKKFLKTRGDKEYYSLLINDANKEFKLIFHTSKRFFEDFCQDEAGDNLLVSKLDKNSEITVKMLLLDEGYLSDEDKAAFEISKNEILRLTKKYPKRFFVRFYKHTPNHNLFLTEKDAVIGPYFENTKGKYLPSIHFRSNAEFVQPYKDYFDKEWEDAQNTN